MECAEVSLVGQREENQDRARIDSDAAAALVMVVDGMGGHSDGALAAETAVRVVGEAFADESHPLFDPTGFLHLAIGHAHDSLVDVAGRQHVDARPRATCAVCLVQDDGLYCAHVGDSRVYLLRGGDILTRSRDHSHVELLLREGLISEDEVATHPMRNYVECCLGGDEALPEMSISGRQRLQPGDIVLACSDGFWSGLRDEDITLLCAAAPGQLADVLGALARRAVEVNAPYSDNTTAAALRWLG